MRSIIRVPSIMKSLRARTTSRVLRALKRTFLPWYGKKGFGLLLQPKRAIYNKVYKKTSFSIFDLFK